MKNFNSLSRTSKYPILFSFYSELKKFNNINPQKEHRNEKKLCIIMQQNYIMSI